MIDKEQASLEATLPNENLEYVYGPFAGIVPSSDVRMPLRQAGITVPEHCLDQLFGRAVMPVSW